MPKLPAVKWDEENKVWFSRAYLGTNASTGERIRKRVSFHCDTEQEAQEESDNYWSHFNVIAGRSIDGTVRSWMETYLLFIKECRSPNTYRTYRTHYRNRFSESFLAKQLLDVTKADVIRWSDSQSNVSSATKRNAYQFLLGTWTFAIQTIEEEGRTIHNVVKEAPISMPIPRNEAVPAERREVESLIDESMDGVEDRMLTMAIILAATTGMRAGEVCALTPDCVRLDILRPTIYVRGSVTEGTRPITIGPTKSKRSRSVTLGEETARILADHIEWKDSLFGKSAPIITTNGKLMRPSHLSRMFTERRNALGLESGITFHSLRHYAATLMLHSGMPVAVVCSRLGHATQATTMNIYSHVMLGDDAMAASVTDIRR